MDVEKTENKAKKDLQCHLFVNDENGNKFTCNKTTQSSINTTININGNSASQYSEISEREDNVGFKDIDDITSISSDQECIGALDLQKTAGEFISRRASLNNTDATCTSSATEQTCIYAWNHNVKEPTSLRREDFTLKGLQNPSTEQPVPSRQFDYNCKMHVTPVEQSKNSKIEMETGCAYVPLNNISVSEPVDMVKLGGTLGSDNNHTFLPLTLISSDEMHMRKNFDTSNAEKPPNTSVQETSGGLNALSNCTNMVVLPLASPVVGEQCLKGTNCVEAPQNRKFQEMEMQSLKFVDEWLDPNCKNLVSPEHFNLDKDSKPYMHSTPESAEMDTSPTRMVINWSINDLGALPIQSFSVSKDQEQVVNKVSQHVTKEQNVSAKKNAFQDAHSHLAVSKSTQSNPHLEGAATPELKCEATFLIFSPRAGEAIPDPYTSTLLTGSEEQTFSVSALAEGRDGPSKLGKNDALMRGHNRKTSLKTSSELIAAKPKNQSPIITTITKVRKAEIVSFPKPNFKNVKPKVISRAVLQSKDNASLKVSPRSPQLSTASSSSPVSSPRQLPSSVKALRKKSDLDRDIKAEIPVTKFHKQPLNKQLFPSQVVHATTHSKNTSHKIPKTLPVKQTLEVGDKASASNSTSSSVSAAVVTCVLNSKGKLNDKMESVKSLTRPCVASTYSSGAENEQNYSLGTLLAVEELKKDQANETFEVGSVPLISSAKTRGVQGKNIHKEGPIALRSIAAPKVKVVPSVFRLRRGSENKNICTTKKSSPQKAVLPSSSGRPASVKTSLESWASSGKSLTKSKVPIRRTPSISSINSTQSEQSTCSNNSTSATIIIKNGEWPSKATCQNGISGPISLKPVPRPRLYSLKSTPKGTKNRSSSLNQCTPKSAGPFLPVRKTSELRGNQPLGTPGLNGPQRLLSVFSSVDKSKQRGPRSSCIQTQTSPDEHTTETKTRELAQYKAKCENLSEIILRLKKLLASSHQKFEALTIVIQHLQSEKEEALKQHKELSQEFLNLRGELVTTAAACEKLERDRNELQAAYEGFVQKLNQQHQNDLTELEERLKQFYTGECEKLQSICIEEAEKYKAQLQEQVDNLNFTHENFKLELETSHAEKIDELKKEYESSLSELKNAHELEKNSFEDSFKEKQESLEKKIEELKRENDSLNEKLKLEEQKQIAKEKANLKNPQIMYLEQELESLKAVLEIKNEKLHQQDMKLMKMEKQVEKNTGLNDKIKKIQQENEELKARMDKHMERSRQLSTEQAVLQESLEKESKVNKRLSMENEELLWKLHNGDMCSPRKVSPTSPLPSPSPRNSGSFSAPTVAPR